MYTNSSIFSINNLSNFLSWTHAHIYTHNHKPDSLKFSLRSSNPFQFSEEDLNRNNRDDTRIKTNADIQKH